MENNAPHYSRIAVKTSDGNIHEIKNSELIPAYYCLPEEILMNMQTPVRGLPRRPSELLRHPAYIKIIESDLFLEHICDAYAYLVWPAMGMKGWMEYYSGFAPQWIIAHETSLWVDWMQQIGVMPTNRQLFFPPLCFQDVSIPSLQQVYEMAAAAAPYVLGIFDQQMVIDIANEFPCEEDFDQEKKHNRRLQNFRQKWYHRRTRHPMVSYEAIIEDDGSVDCCRIMDIPSEDDTEEEAVARMHGQAFFNTLSPIDQQIIYLRGRGKTLEQVAKLVGFSTHSAVLKRIRKIGKAYELWSGEDLGFRKEGKKVPAFDYDKIRRQKRVI